MRILVAGSLAFDRILNFDGLFSEHILPDKIHSINVSFFAPDMKESLGGCAGNISYSLALMGDTPVILARAGKDFAQYSQVLARAGVDTSLIELDQSVVTAAATILTDRKDNQITAFHPGAMGSPYTFGTLEGDFVIIGPTNPVDMQTLPALCREAQIPFMFDPGQQIPVLSADDLRNGITGAKVVISNDYEQSLIMVKTGWSVDDILAHAEILVTTLGENGSIIKTKNETINIPPAKPLSIKDPTGAGDAYRSGFVHALLKGWPLDVAGRLAGLVAIYAVETQGTQAHGFTLDEIRTRYQENFNSELPTN
jgi:adenosine kinase